MFSKIATSSLGYDGGRNIQILIKQRGGCFQLAIFNRQPHRCNRCWYFITSSPTTMLREARWPSGTASGFDPHSDRRVVPLSKIHLPPKKYW